MRQSLRVSVQAPRKVVSRLGRRLTCSALAEAEDLKNLMKYAPVGERYLVTKFEREAKTDAGILLAQTAAENQSQGENLLIGQVHAVPELEEGAPTASVKVGDKILFAKYGCTEATVENTSVYFVKATEVLATIE